MPELDLLDRKILYELDMDSRISVSKLAKLVSTSKETVNFRLKRLVKNGYVKRFITTLFTSHLNMFYYKLFYKFHKTTPEIDNQIIEFISTYERTAYFAEFEGPYNLGFLLVAKSHHDLDEFITKFRKHFGDYILDQQLHILTSIHRFNLKFFYRSDKTLHTKYPKELKQIEVDRKDMIIIKDLANNSRTSLAELAHHAGIDSSTAIYRIKKLKQNKILGTYTLALDFAKFGMQHFQINFKLKDRSSVDRIINYFSSNNNATFAIVALGKYDLAIELVAKDNIELRRILDKCKEHFAQDIIDHDTFLIVKEHVLTWLPHEA